MTNSNSNRRGFHFGVRIMARSSCLLAVISRSSQVAAFTQKYGSFNHATISNRRKCFAFFCSDTSVRINESPSFKNLEKKMRLPFSSSSLCMSVVNTDTDTDTSPTTNNKSSEVIFKRVKTADISIDHEAVQSKEIITVKGWVRTVRKQKTLVFVEVNDGSNLKGVQCVLPFDSIDENSIEGKNYCLRKYIIIVDEMKFVLFSFLQLILE